MKHVMVGVMTMLTATLAHADTLRMAVTTSFNSSGLADILIPAIERDLGLAVHLLVVGTGQALRLGRSGDVDVVLVHSRSAEENFIAAGFATHRREIMYNDFVVLGPSDDPADVSGAATAVQTFARIAVSGSLFVSRGDDSGTHNRETELWRLTGIAPEPSGDWYRSVGAGMGAALNVAAAMHAYVLSDRASWLNFRRKVGLVLLFAGDPLLFNQYSLLPINPEKHPHIRSAPARSLEAWLVSSRAAALIDGYRIGGERLFTHNAKVSARIDDHQ